MAYTLKIDEIISMKLEFQPILDETIVYIVKDSVRAQKIGLKIAEVQKIMDISGEISQVVERFGDGSIEILKKFRLSENIYLVLKTCGNGISIDVRRYCTINGELMPMRVGVNINATLLRPLMNGFVEMLEEAESM